MLNPIFRIDLVPAPSQGFMRDPFGNTDLWWPDKTKSKMYRFFEFTELFVLSLLFRPRKWHQKRFTVVKRWRKLEFTRFLATFLI